MCAWGGGREWAAWSRAESPFSLRDPAHAEVMEMHEHSRAPSSLPRSSCGLRARPCRPGTPASTAPTRQSSHGASRPSHAPHVYIRPRPVRRLGRHGAGQRHARSNRGQLPIACGRGKRDEEHCCIRAALFRLLRLEHWIRRRRTGMDSSAKSRDRTEIASIRWC